MKKHFFISFVLLLSICFTFFTGCPVPNPEDPPTSGKNKIAVVTKTDTHYEVVLDYSSGATHRQMGEAFGKEMIEVFNKSKPVDQTFQYLMDSYIADLLSNNTTAYTSVMLFVNFFKDKIPQDYIDEIEGLASTACDVGTDAIRDGKFTKNELYFMELILDVTKQNQCSAISVFDASSDTGKTVTGRVLDFSGGSTNQLAKISAITRIKNGDKSIVLVGYLGYLAGLTVINDDKIFSAILESRTNEALSITPDLHSYSMDLRYAMENNKTIDGVAAYMSVNKYISGHLVFLSDPVVSKVLENNQSPTGSRVLRNSNSVLNPGISWDIPNAIGCVNSFVLNGNFNNHYDTGNPNNYKNNYMRWSSIKNQMALKGNKISNDEVAQIISYYTGSAPAKQEDGDLYNESTQQMIVIEPDTLTLKVFFKPMTDDGTLPINPIFETYKISF